jgi:hypothetical protein
MSATPGDGAKSGPAPSRRTPDHGAHLLQRPRRGSSMVSRVPSARSGWMPPGHVRPGPGSRWRRRGGRPCRGVRGRARCAGGAWPARCRGGGRGVEADRRAERGGEQEEPVPADHRPDLLKAGHPHPGIGRRIGDVGDGEPGEDDAEADRGLTAGAPAEQRVGQHEQTRDGQQVGRVDDEDFRHVPREHRAEGDGCRGQGMGAAPQQRECHHHADGEHQRGPCPVLAEHQLEHRARHEHSDQPASTSTSTTASS